MPPIPMPLALALQLLYYLLVNEWLTLVQGMSARKPPPLQPSSIPRWGGHSQSN